MFEWSQIESLNALEMDVYSYVIANTERVSRMKIRELAQAAHVSTSTVLRFCSKMGCDGYSDFRYRLRNLPRKDEPAPFQTYAQQAIDFLQKARDDAELEQKLSDAARIILSAGKVIFYGIGSSGALCQYGARFFSNVGVYAVFLNDPFYPRPGNYFEDAVLFVLSVSGETKQVVDQVSEYKKQHATIISICNSDRCTVARLSDLTFPTFMPFLRFKADTNDIDLTPQLPTLFLLEALGRRLQSELSGDIHQN